MNRHSKEYMDKLGIERIGRTRAIRLKCGECMGGDRGVMPLGDIRTAVDECGATCCPLWPFRLGTDPWRAEPTEAQREAGRRLAEKVHN